MVTKIAYEHMTYWPSNKIIIVKSLKLDAQRLKYSLLMSHI